MGLKKILKAAFKIKNSLLLFAVLLVSYLTGYLPFTFIGLAGYVYFVLQTLKDEESENEYSESENIDGIRKLSLDCNDLYNRVRKTVDRQALIKIREILQEKDELMNLFYQDKEDFLKQKVVEQALNLVIAYIRLISDFNLRIRDFDAVDINKVKDRINNSERKLLALKDQEAISDLKSAIEMDRELIDKIGNERIQLQRISAKLDYIESAVRTLKHQIITSEDTDKTVAEIQNVINEAAALDNVLDQSRNERLRL